MSAIKEETEVEINEGDRLFRKEVSPNLAKRAKQKMKKIGKTSKPELVNELLTKWVNEE